MDDDHVEKVLTVIRQNRRLTVREIAEEVGICKSSCHLKMRRAAAKICVASADRCTKTEPCHSQSGAVRSFECWWKPSEKCHNRLWNSGVRPQCWNKSAALAVDGKIVATTKKSTPESLKCEGDIDSLFLFEGYHSLWVCSTWSGNQ